MSVATIRTGRDWTSLISSKRRGIGRTGGRVRSGGRTSPAHQPPLVQFESGSLRPLLLPAGFWSVPSVPSVPFRFLSVPSVPSGSSGSSLPPRIRFPGLSTDSSSPVRVSSPPTEVEGLPSLTQFLSLCRSAVRSPATGGLVPPDGFTQPSPRLVPEASHVPIFLCSVVVRSPCGFLPPSSRIPADACSITFTPRREWFASPLLRLVPLPWSCPSGSAFL